MPPLPVTLTFDLFTLKVVSESHVTWATYVPILVFMGNHHGKSFTQCHHQSYHININKNKRESYFYASSQNCGVLKTPQAPGNATVLKRFSAITSLFFVVDRKEYHFFESVNLSSMHIFNFSDAHVIISRTLQGPISAEVSGQNATGQNAPGQNATNSGIFF